jgi:hypothetical protein
MAYGILISNNVGTRKSVPVFDSRNPANAMMQVIDTFTVTAGSTGSRPIPMPVVAREVTDLGVAAYPNTASGNPPNVKVEGYTVSWDYANVSSPTAATIVVLT